MINRTIEIAASPARLRVKNEQLLIERDGEPTGSVPLEDIGLVVIDQRESTISTRALQGLAQHQAAVIICDSRHLPAGMFVPLVGHSTLQHRLDLQLSASRPLRKHLWRQIIRAKIAGQARALPAEFPVRARLLAMARSVRSGDPENVEAQAARFYWEAWLGPDLTFRRDQDGDGLNALLNYGYAVIRATLARACVIAGLQPAIGIHHANRSNPFCLVDDLLEPLRPVVDCAVRDLYLSGKCELCPETKRELLALLYKEVRYDDQKSPLVVAIQRYVFGFVRCLDRTAPKLLFVRW